ncbi:RNA-binding protein spenito-like [Amphibalanus amphitrite]|nr:RNA-binding protein spenito-like [Amphibalanus amphitrite]XP_043223219.1 RNA-binding protein spenito-like [Amphibalanus amphitrite]
MGRYDNSSDEGSSRRGRSRSPRRTPPRYSQEPSHSRSHSHRDGGGYSRSSDRDRAYTYKVLCVSSIHPKASEDVVRDELYREYRKFPDVSVKVVIEHDGERVAYVYFRTWEDARDAKHISRGRIMFYDKPAMVEAVYDTAPQEYLPRRRSRSPMMDYPPMDGRYMRPRSPPRDYDRYGPPMPGPMDPYGYELQPHDPYGYGPGRGYPYREPPRGPPFGGGYGPPYGPPGFARPRFERHERKERFPNYLHHIPPEDDPTACRTLFAGNMELNITEEELRRIFNRYGNVEDIDIKRPPPGTGNAFAFVRFENLDQSNRCKTELSGQYIGKFQVKIGYGKVLPSCKVWVGGLGSWTTVQILEREFDRFGAIKKIEYVKGEPYAHVLYETLDAATAAVNEMRGFPLGGPDKRIKTDFAADETTVQFGRRPPFDGGHDDFRGRGRGGFRGGRGNFRGGFGDRGDFSEDNYHSTLRQVPTENRSISPSRRSESGSEEGGHLNTAKTLSDIARKVGTSWHGAMILKSSLFACKFHLTDGDADIAESLLKDENEKPLLRITQRLRLDQPKLDDVQKRISSSPHAIYVALPTSSSPVNIDDSSVQARSLRNLVSYLKQKEAAGVISLLNKEGDTTGVLYAFPPCNFSKELLTRTATALSEEAAKEDHLLVVVVRGSSAQLALS